MSMNRGLENSRNSSKTKQVSGSYSPEGYHKLKEAMHGKFQKNDKLIEKIKKSQIGVKAAPQLETYEDVIKLKPCNDEEEGGIFQTPSKSNGEVFSAEASHQTMKQQITANQEVQTE